ncbi:MAG: hypothetical protein JNM17_22940 [Archangium sp.]|nr:hypothetical protein [Archangium sp.]
MKRTLLTCLSLAFVLSACGVESTLSTGTFRGTTDSLTGATLSFDVTSRTGSIMLGGQSTTFGLESSQFGQSCPGNLSSVRTESRAVTVDPLVVGSVSLPGVVIRAGCGLSPTGGLAATDDVVLISGTRQFGFERQ